MEPDLGEKVLSGAGDPRFRDEAAIPKRVFCVVRMIDDADVIQHFWGKDMLSVTLSTEEGIDSCHHLDADEVRSRPLRGTSTYNQRWSTPWNVYTIHTSSTGLRCGVQLVTRTTVTELKSIKTRQPGLTPLSPSSPAITTH